MTALDLSTIAVTTAQQRDARAAQAAAKRNAAPRAHATSQQWVREQAPRLAERTGLPLAKLEASLDRAASDRHVLTGEHPLLSQSGVWVTVAEILADPDRFDGAGFADPLDPDTDTRVAVVRLRTGGRPFLWTNRHGGIKFELVPQAARILLAKGLRTQATDAVVQVLRALGDLYDYGDGLLAYINDGRVRVATDEYLLDDIGRVCEFYRVKIKGEESIEIPDDPPAIIAKSIMARVGTRRFPRLVAVITAPTLRADGSILKRPGYDEDSGLFLYTEEAAPTEVPETPFPVEAVEAFRVLWEPFRLFPFVDAVSRGVFMHALITATIRASLPTAPGTAFDSTGAGNGKSLLARCIALLGTGREPAMLPPVDGEDETRKRLFAALLTGASVILWDNVRDIFGNASIDAFLTADTFADRPLNTSTTCAVPNRALFLTTGNNFRLQSDTCRRILVTRIDSQSETPYAREFAFDPAQTVKAQRLQLVAAALTIIRAHIAAGSPRAAVGRTASFELWDDLVRQPICWLAGLIEAHNVSHPHDPLPTLADPMRSAHAAFENDPETSKHRALLEAWHIVFGDTPTRVATAINAEAFDGPLHTAIDEIAGQNGRTNPRILGRWIERMAGRRIGGRYFQRAGIRSGNVHWQVLTDGKQPTNDTTLADLPDDIRALFGN